MSRFVLACICLAALLSGRSADAQAPKAKDDAKELVGKWKIVAADIDSFEWDAETLEHQRIVFSEDGKFKFERGGGLLKTDEGTYQADSTKTPKTLDLKPTKGLLNGKPFVGIYELKNGKLTICCGSPSFTDDKPAQRPKKFVPKPEFGVLRMTLEKAE